METIERNKQIIRRFVEAGNARDFDALGQIVSPAVERYCPATPDVDVRSWDDFRRFLETDARTFPDNRITLHTLVAEGDAVGFWATYTGTQTGWMGTLPPSGKRVTCEFSGIFQVERGKITRLRLTWDNVAVLAQLGHLPPVAGAGPSGDRPADRSP